METIELIIKNGKKEIPATLFRGQNVEQVIVYMHGYMSERKSATILNIAVNATVENIAILSFDMADHGDRKGKSKLTVKGGISDFKAAIAYARENICPRVSVLGSSLGAYFGLFAAKSDTAIEHIMLRSPALNPRKTLHNLAGSIIAHENNHAFKALTSLIKNVNYDDNFDNEKFDTFKHFKKRFNCEIDIIYGDRDELVPKEDIDKFVAKNTNKIKLVVLDGEKHGFNTVNARSNMVSWVLNIMKNTEKA